VGHRGTAMRRLRWVKREKRKRKRKREFDEKD